MLTLVDNKLSSYEVPHRLSWLIHVKVFGYVGWSGPTHILNVYLKSGGNFRRKREDCLEAVKKIINDAKKQNPESHFVVLGDMNEDGLQVYKHLRSRKEINLLTIAPIVGSVFTRFSVKGRKQSLDHILLDSIHAKEFKCAQVCQGYNVSDHRLVIVRPKKQLSSARAGPNQVKFDNKMIRLCGDKVVNDNSWLRVMTDAYGKNWTLEGEQEGEAQMLVSNQQRAFAENFDVICCKHKAKEDRRSKARPYYP